jgi:hypothetical protein
VLHGLRLRRLLSAAGALILTVVALELAARVLYRPLSGTRFDAAEVAGQRSVRLSAIESRLDAAAGGVGLYRLHP